MMRPSHVGQFWLLNGQEKEAPPPSPELAGSLLKVSFTKTVIYQMQPDSPRLPPQELEYLSRQQWPSPDSVWMQLLALQVSGQ